MKNLFLTMVSLLLLVSCGGNQNKKQAENNVTLKSTTTTVSDQDISDAYFYLLGRNLVLKQERLDFEKEGFKWNTIIHREPGKVEWANPNLDVAYSEAWVAVDENTCVLLEIPKITGRYYTWHMLNGWGETILNINERTFPQQPYGKYALCLKGSNPKIPEGALRVDLPCKTSRVLARVELGNNVNEAVRLQKQFKLTPQGEPKVDKYIDVPLLEGGQRPGADLFDNASAILASEADINEGMEPLQAKVKEVEAFVKASPENKTFVDKVITEQVKPELTKRIVDLGVSQNGWTRPKVVGNYGSDYHVRTIVNIIGIWANNEKEAIYFGRTALDGGKTYVMAFPKDALPKDKAKYFWSVVAVDFVKFQVLPNSLNRYIINNQSKLKYNADGSLTLVFSPNKPTKYPVSNWLPTIKDVQYSLTLRYYGPTTDVTGGQYFPPQMETQE